MTSASNRDHCGCDTAYATMTPFDCQHLHSQEWSGSTPSSAMSVRTCMRHATLLLLDAFEGSMKPQTRFRHTVSCPLSVQCCNTSMIPPFTPVAITRPHKRLNLRQGTRNFFTSLSLHMGNARRTCCILYAHRSAQLMTTVTKSHNPLPFHTLVRNSLL